MWFNQCPTCQKTIGRNADICIYCGTIIQSQDEEAKPLKPILPAEDNKALIHDRYKAGAVAVSEKSYKLYNGTDIKLNRQCTIAQFALRNVDFGFTSKLNEIGSQMARLNHPGLAVHLDHFESEGCFYVIEEKVSGTTLQKIKEDSDVRLNTDNLVTWLIEICDAIAYLHSKGVIHGNLNPNSIVMGSTGHVKIINLHTAWLYQQAAGNFLHDKQANFYKAPEISSGNPIVQSDIYSVGVIIRLLISGMRSACPSNADSQPLSMEKQIINELTNTAVKASNVEINKRFVSVSEMRIAISTISNNRPDSIAFKEKTDSSQFEYVLNGETRTYVTKPAIEKLNEAVKSPLPLTNWFERHLNLTFLFVILGWMLIVLIFGFSIGLSNTEISDSLSRAISYTTFFLFVIPMFGWILHRKGRSIANLFWLLCPLVGGIIFLVIILGENNRNPI